MMGLADPGTRIWVEPNDDPHKKLKFGWRLVEHHTGHFTGVDTSLPNKLLKIALINGDVPELSHYKTVLPEQKYGKNSRIDFLLRQNDHPDAYIEVKSVTLSRQTGLAEFPDCVTARGAKHLQELTNMAISGHRAVLFYLVQRTDCDMVSVAADIDPVYAKALQMACKTGVEILAYSVHITPNVIEIGQNLIIRDPIALVL